MFLKYLGSNASAILSELTEGVRHGVQIPAQLPDEVAVVGQRPLRHPARVLQHLSNGLLPDASANRSVVLREEPNTAFGVRKARADD